MKLYRETAIYKRADKATIAMLDLWRSLSEEKVGVQIEVMAGNRREHQQLSSFSGELNTAWPVTVEGKVVLTLWLDSFINVNPLVITHEIGHWVLKLQGVLGFIYQPQPHSNIEILLNSFAHHPLLYALQRSLGHEPQPEIDSRVLNDIKVFSNKKETRDTQSWIANALLFADDLTNCSDTYQKRLKGVVKRKHPNTAKLLNRILALVPHYNPIRPDKNFQFSRRPIQRRIIKDLKLGAGWREIDEAETLKSMVDTARKGVQND